MIPTNLQRRRHFLRTTAALLTAPILSDFPLTAAGRSSGKPVQLRATGDDLFRVRTTIEVEGNVNLPKNALVSREAHKRLRLQSDAVFDYEERYVRPPRGENTAGPLNPVLVNPVLVVERFYHDAKSKIAVNRGESQGTLRDSVRETVVRRETLPELIYAVDDYFRHDELELLHVPVCSAAVDELLPRKAVESGSTYAIDDAVIASVLNLSSVEANDVQAEIVSIEPRSAKLQLKGNVDGSVDGVPTVIRLIAKLTYDRLQETCTWLAMAIHETREIGRAEPGFDVAATIKMIRKPMERPVGLAEQPRDYDFTTPPPAERLYVDLQSDQLNIGALMDRRWRMMSDLPGSAMMRMTESDRSIAQCDFKSLAATEPGKRIPLGTFQNDVRQTLGEQLTRLVSAEEQTSPQGLHVLRVQADGQVEGIPIQWVMLHFSDESGRRVLATFTMEAAHAAAFGGSDAQLANSLRFLDPAVTDPDSSSSRAVAAEQTGDSADDNPDGKAGKSGKRGDRARREVQSASDVR